MRAYELLILIRFPYFQKIHGLPESIKHRSKRITKTYTHAGHPITIDAPANTLHPFPYPSAPNIAGANRGNPKPAKDRRHDTAASAVGKVR